MGIQDLIITPIYFFLLLFAAYRIRSLVTNQATKPYFIPGLLVKFTGAIALGLIYQFYYGGGDTFTFHTHGSRWIWQAFINDPILGLKMLLSDGGSYNGSYFIYSSRIWMYRDESSYFLIRIAALIDIFTFSTYSATGLFFASFAFSGLWALFTTFQSLCPKQTRQFSLAYLFIPSVIFWGSGILKDSITLGALCWMTYFLFQITIFKKNHFISVVFLIFFGWIIFSIKIYILLCFLVSTVCYLYFQNLSKIKNLIVKITLAPIFLVAFTGAGYLILNKITEGSSRYAIGQIAETAKTTAYDIRYGWGARQGDNSGYTLGELDGSLRSLISLAPKGIIVTLFRPWLWEIKNPLMVLAALESLFFLCATIYCIYTIRFTNILKSSSLPLVIFCLSFSLLFAFAIGVSTYNFGTLMRYKIPVLPFYSSLLILILELRQNS